MTLVKSGYLGSKVFLTEIKKMSVELQAHESGQNNGEAAQQQPPTAVKQTDVDSLPCFNTRGDTNSLCSSWKRWKRAFNLYVTAKGVTDDGQKTALLLHTAGMDFQELYYTLSNDEDKSFHDSIELLDGYFITKTNAAFERHLATGPIAW